MAKNDVARIGELDSRLAVYIGDEEARKVIERRMAAMVKAYAEHSGPSRAEALDHELQMLSTELNRETGEPFPLTPLQRREIIFKFGQLMEQRKALQAGMNHRRALPLKAGSRTQRKRLP